MKPYDFIQKEYHDCHAFAYIQMLRSCYCILQRWEFTDLSGPFWRWYTNDTAGAFIVAGGKHFELESGKICLIPPNTVFSSGTTRPVGHLYLHFSITLNRLPEPGTIFFHTATAEESELAQKLTYSLKHPGRGAGMAISFQSQALAGLALDTLPVEYWGDQLPDQRIELVLQKIHRNAPHATSNQELARDAGLNVNAFISQFKSATGYTPQQYLLKLRMETASQLLRFTPESVDTIAEKTGFCDRFHFSRAFQKFYHIAPAAFRRGALKSM